ncbi:cellular nucleic acid-binding protein-like [Ananas comosus]|uniref:Cellular nucleic acid-binding protein-like n=1 Tax=Ananas comosus TaxID=4615 RepID=A0A6P5HD60_ANACO|nr:cellular nucleic acid-binding protein-like [Ananas comosus]
MILDAAAGEARQERKAFKESGVKKRPRGGSGKQSSSKKAPKYQKRRSVSQGPMRCVICGGGHRAGKSRDRAGRCFKCGRAGHMARQCAEGVPPAPSVASAPEIQQLFGGVPSATAVSTRCVICGGSHQARRCVLRKGRCFRCGQSGH